MADDRWRDRQRRVLGTGPVPRRRRARLNPDGSARQRGPDKRFGLGRRTRRALLVGGAVVAALILTMAGLVVYAAFTLPNIDDINKATGTIKILDRHGALIAEVGRNGQNQTTVPIGQIAPILQQATVAAEDRNFYNEGAFDFKRVVKAVIDDFILHRPAEGASTITQQLVKESFFGQQASKSPLRKIREALLAQEIEGKWSKQQILDQYLNITYYGENAYGVENASERYFGKHASQLTLPEAALLAGLPQAPSYNDPYANPDAAYARMHYVLVGLVAMGAVTQPQAAGVDPLVGGDSPTPAQAAAQQQNQQSIHADLLNGQPNVTTSPAPHFVQYIENQLAQQFAADPSYLNGSLLVTTTLDLNTQSKAQKAVADGVAKIGHGVNNGALLMLDAYTGQILAMVGSADFNDNSIAGQFNVAIDGERRPGSSFKPYVYEEGFKEGVLTPSTMLDDTYQQSLALGGVPDFDGRYLGRITAARALLLSRNIATEQAMEIAGVKNVINFARSLGITTPLAANASTAIGTNQVFMSEHAAAYAAFANGGHKVSAYGILRVVDGSGNVLADNTQPPGEGTVMTPSQAWAITNILRGYAHYWGLPIKWDTAGKSGTTDQYKDAWYMAYTPSWVVATWAGHTSSQSSAEVPTDGVFGTTTGTYIAAPFIDSLPKPGRFVPVNGSPSDCASPDASVVNQSGCPSPSASASPTPSPSESATPVPTESFSPAPSCPTGSPSPSIGPIGTPSPCVTPTPP